MQKTHTSGGLNMSRGFKAILIPGCFAGEEISDVCGVEFGLLVCCSDVDLDLGRSCRYPLFDSCWGESHYLATGDPFD